MPPWLAPLAIGLTAIAARWAPRLKPTTAARLLESRIAPVVFGALTALAVWWAWGSLRALPWVHDEKAFLLQAELFARGRWSGPSPPIPEFFEQFGVLVTPALASK